MHLVENLTQSVPEEIERYKHLIKSIDQTATEKAIMDALEKSRELLPANHKTTVCIFPSVDRDALPTVTVGSGKITVFYSGFFSLNQLKTAIAHEYHHSYWTERHFNPTDTPTVLDTLVFEGKAVKFEKLVYPEFDFNIIDPVFHKEYWEAIKDDLDSTDVKRAQQIVMGGDEIPSFYGISEGFKIVDHLIKKENLTVEEWTAIPASEALKRGKYEENYK